MTIIRTPRKRVATETCTRCGRELTDDDGWWMCAPCFAQASPWMFRRRDPR